MTSDDTYQVPNLKDHFISEKQGFILENNLETLPSYFEPWNRLSKKMPELVQTKVFQDQVNQMPLLDPRRLVDENEWILAHVQLSVIAAGYVWQNGKANPARRLPEQVAKPLWRISQHLNVAPMYIYLDLALANMVPIDSSRPMSIDNMRALYLMPGGQQCEWFFKVLSQVEIDAVQGIKAMVDAKKAIVSQDRIRLMAALNRLTASVATMENTLKRIPEGLQRDVFKETIQPFLQGYGPGSPLTEGLVYDGVSSTPKQYIGSTSAMSSTFAFLDAVLNITSPEERANYLGKMQFYMHPAHLRFLILMTEGPSIRKFAMDRRDPELVRKFGMCMQQITDFKTTHFNLISKFVA